MREPDLCRRCERVELYYESEHDSGLCGDCQDTLIERSQERREFDHYHPGESDD